MQIVGDVNDGLFVFVQDVVLQVDGFDQVVPALVVELDFSALQSHWNERKLNIVYKVGNIVR